MDTSSLVGRRGLFTAAGAGAVLATTAGGLAAGATPSQAHGWRPTPEPQDAWMELPGRHRMAFDAISVQGAGDAIQFANNFYLANQDGYGIGPHELGVIVILRHFATAYALSDATWARWGEEFGKLAGYTDARTKAAPRRNTLLTTDSTDPEEALASLSGLAQRGARFAVCDLALQWVSKHLAEKEGVKADAVHAQLLADFIPNAHLSPAGVVALNRAQEHGYAVAHIG